METWRKVDGLAVRCTGCPMNKTGLLNEEPQAINRCDAEGEICIFMKKKIDSHKTYADFHDVYRNIDGGAEA